jgi:hypothetical protein
MLFVGATLHGGTYRVSDGFGRQRGRPALDRQNVDYREISAIVGGRWQLARGAALQVSVGEMLDRRFTFDDRNLLLNGDSAPTIQVSFTRVF